MRNPLLPTALLAAGLFASGCANLDTISPGTPAAAVEASRGKPSRVWQEAGGGASWEYPTGPQGKYTYMVRVGADGRVTRVDQVLGWDVFRKVDIGMTTQDVEHLLGRPYNKATYSRTGQTAWAWRFMETVWPRCFFAYFGPDGKVAGTGSRDELPATMGPGLSIPC